MDITARSFTVPVLRADVFMSNYSTVLAGGTFPGPVIQGTKVEKSQSTAAAQSNHLVFQDAEFSINVIDSLTDTSMNVATSIVILSFFSFFYARGAANAFIFYSTGTAFSNRTQTTLMVLHLLPSALLFQETASSTILKR